MNIKELKANMEGILQTAKVVLKKEGNLVPMAFVYHDDIVDIIALLFRDRDEKDRQLSMLRDVVKKKNADAILFVTESWYVTTVNEKIDIAPSKDPRRKESIMILGECEDGNNTIIQLFDRKGGKENGKIIFVEKMDMGETISWKFNFGIKDRKKQKIERKIEQKIEQKIERK